MPWPQDGGRSPPQILMVDPKDRFVFTPLLVDYAISGDIELDEFAPKYSELLGFADKERPYIPGAAPADVEHLEGSVVGIDWRRRVAVVCCGGEEQSLEFDVVVISPGLLARPRTPLELVRGAEGVVPFSTLADAEALRARLNGGAGPAPRAAAVVGAGYVGAEVAACLAEREPDCAVTLFGSELLRGSEPENRRRAAERLEQLGVERRAGRVVAACSAGVSWRPPAAEAGPGAGEEPPLQRHACDLVIVTGAAAAVSAECKVEPPLPPREGAAASDDGSRYRVDDFLRIVPGVFCIGDAARAQGSPPTGQAAMQQAEVAAWNVFAQLTGMARRSWRRYAPSAMGEFVVLGSQDAAAVVAPARLTKLLPPALPPSAAAAVAPVLGLAAGLGEDAKADLGGTPAALLRRLSYLYRMPTLAHRANVAKRWAGRAKELGAALPG